MLQLVRGLHDPEIQRKLLQEGAAVKSGELSLSTVVKLVEAAEMGNVSQALVTKAGGLNKMTEPQRGKQRGRQDK